MTSSHDDTQPRDLFGTVIPAGGPSLPDLAESMLKGLDNLTTSITDVGGLPFLGISRGGQWKFGPEQIKVREGAELAVDIRTMKHGYACWDEGELLGEQLVSVGEPLPDPRSLPATGAEWKHAVAFEALFITGPDAGTKVLYKNNSVSGLAAVKGLGNAIKAQFRVDPNRLIPVLHLRTDSYTHKKYGEIFTPVFEVVRWAGLGDAAAKPAQPAQPEAAKPSTPPVSGRRRSAA